ncbi:hypothetical protein PPROV_000547500 [Pycnococcus provasolii]|uniref:Uncharacterized protein n=1 Tax=Pycnococcus provasolii TaxID=41880 RepID=A0A830HME4_9CHLO|nr:hypothetical protein PPROV_000547500 [Pycnococcus provasolii]
MSEKMADVDKRTSQWNEVTPRSASKAVRVKSWAAVTAAAVPMRSLAFLDLYSHPVTEQYFHVTPMSCTFARCRVISVPFVPPHPPRRHEARQPPHHNHTHHLPP